jgi:hypothetical protein
MQMHLVRFTKRVSPLLSYAKNITSQFGEDGIIARLVELLTPPDYCVEFGAWDGKHLSNCHQLVAKAGWHGVMIETNEDKYRDLVETYAGNGRVHTVQRFVDFEGPNRLDMILKECGAPQTFGILSVDIDGNDYHVWKSLEMFSPEIAIVEFNQTIPNDVFFVQDRSFDVNHGCSLLALILLGKEKGYELAVCTETNAFFVRREKFPKLGIRDNSINTLYRPVQDGRIFQGYDGTIHVVGMDHLIWKQIPLSHEDFQVLPRGARTPVDAQRKPHET